MSLLRHLSIPSSENAWCKKRRILSALSPMFAGQVTLLAFYGWEIPNLLIFNLTVRLTWVVLGCCAALTAIMFCTSNDEIKPPYFPLSVTCAFLMSVVWLDLIANEVVAILEMFGNLLNVSTSVLGLTVLAWGNSVGDLVADRATAKAGGFKSAMASVYASPLLSALVGLGLVSAINGSN